MLNSSVIKKKSGIAGYGLFAKENIPKDAVVWWSDSSEKRYSLQELRKLPRELQSRAYQQDGYFLLSSDNSDFMNHSCDPNVWAEGDDKFVARRDIKKGEEITFDYAADETDPRHRGDWKCFCGSKKCRKIIRSTDCLNPEFQKRYKGHLSSWTLEFIQKHKNQRR